MGQVEENCTVLDLLPMVSRTGILLESLTTIMLMSEGSFGMLMIVFVCMLCTHRHKAQ